jgi:hypothetical protein
MRRLLVVLAIIGLGITTAGPAAQACGFLISPNGAVQLLRTSTLVTWENGVERYITNFEFNGEEESFGSIIPLPAEPTSVDKAGDWTLQRLDQEVNGAFSEASLQDAPTALAAEQDGARIVLETRIESLDITVLEGGGDDVVAWADENGFELPPDATEMLTSYSDRSPFFMAARFDATAALEDGFNAGDGVPIMVEIPIENPWVPLEILSLAKPWYEIVEADVYILTPEEPSMFVPEGISLERGEPASDLLLDDLRSDERMEWIPDEAYFSHLVIESEAQNLSYDLAIDASGTGSPSLQAAGVDSGNLLLTGTTLGPTATTGIDGTPTGIWLLIAAMGTITVVAACVATWAVTRVRRQQTFVPDAESLVVTTPTDNTVRPGDSPMWTDDQLDFLRDPAPH